MCQACHRLILYEPLLKPLRAWLKLEENVHNKHLFNSALLHTKINSHKFIDSFLMLLCSVAITSCIIHAWLWLVLLLFIFGQTFSNPWQTASVPEPSPTGSVADGETAFWDKSCLLQAPIVTHMIENCHDASTATGPLDFPSEHSCRVRNIAGRGWLWWERCPLQDFK